MGMFVRKNQRVYFSGRISSSHFTDEFPFPAVLAVLGGFATLREAQISLLFSACRSEAKIPVLRDLLNRDPLGVQPGRLCDFAR